MKKEDVIFERKEFLNLPGHNGMANIIAQLTVNPYESDGVEYRSTYCKLDFADCSRVIHMDIDIEDEYSRENALFKLDTLIDVLNGYRDAVEKEGKYQKRLEKKRARIKAEKKKDGKQV